MDCIKLQQTRANSGILTEINTGKAFAMEEKDIAQQLLENTSVENRKRLHNLFLEWKTQVDSTEESPEEIGTTNNHDGGVGGEVQI